MGDYWSPLRTHVCGDFCRLWRVQYIRSLGGIRGWELQMPLKRVFPSWFLLITLMLTGCRFLGPSEPRRPLGVTLNAEGREEIRFLPCPGETVTSVALEPSGDAGVLWEIASDAGVTLESLVIGDVPQGFTSVIPLKAPLDNSEEVIVVLKSRFRGQNFTVTGGFIPAELRFDRISQGGSFELLSLVEFEEFRRCPNR